MRVPGRRLLVVFAVVPVLCSLLAVGWWLSGRGDDARGTTARPAPSSAADGAQVDEQDAARVRAALLGEPGGAGGLVEGLRAQDAQLPAGSGLQLALQDASVDEAGTLARVPATVTGPLAGPWTVLVARVDGRWRAYGAVPA